MPVTKETLLLPASPDLSELFWLDPSRINEVNQRVNRAPEVAMDLAGMNRSSHPQYEKVRKQVVEVIGDGFLDVIFDHQDPEGSLEEDEQKSFYETLGAFAISSGFLYGTLLPNEANKRINQPEVPEDLLFAFRIWSHQNPNRQMSFLDLRTIEIALTGSDILGFSLAQSQEHMAEIFVNSKRHKNSMDEIYLDEVYSLQTLFYAGAMAGALGVKGAFEKPPTIRTSRDLDEVVLDDSESVVIPAFIGQADALAHFMQKEHVISLFKRKGKPYIGINAGPLQFGPNLISLPFGMNMDGFAARIPFDKTRGLVVGDISKDEPDKIEFRTIKSDKKTSHEELYEMIGNGVIYGVLTEYGYVGAINNEHPWYKELTPFICEEFGIEDFNNINETELRSRVSKIVKYWPVAYWLIGLGAVGMYNANEFLEKDAVEVDTVQGFTSVMSIVYLYFSKKILNMLNLKSIRTERYQEKFYATAVKLNSDSKKQKQS